ncbi:hypothetical protein SKAU_G00193130 [Synaphobranchus kaupii]|uniref:Gypsy retrotransposon integrase-like protein 1 n=1 Tax=Synaphobranchus kaupii TaxID=118154 RepID=A0A9Q1FE20_SYNKA|nr:hypothetical protein SKAU_G00193130 [Synaphobranchus kaupii]
MVSPRVQRWAVTLRAYEYVMVYKAGKDHGNADALSRLPLQHTPITTAPEDRVLMMEEMDTTPVTAEQVKALTNKDPVLARVREHVVRGWPQQTEGDFAPYKVRGAELSVQDGCVLWGARVIIPQPARKIVLEQLHQSHPGVSRMKALARSYIWWPKLDEDIENLVKTCSTCQAHRRTPAAAPLHPWEWPGKPWRRLHMDYAGPFMGKMFLVIIDAHSKWIDVYPVNSATSTTTIDCLRHSFSNQGIPEMIVSDNATCFVSAEAKEFMRNNGIVHMTAAPYHPSSNGLAKRAVQTFKEMMKKSAGGSLSAKLSRVLFSYRITPQSTTVLPSWCHHNQRFFLYNHNPVREIQALGQNPKSVPRDSQRILHKCRGTVMPLQVSAVLQGSQSCQAT